MKRITVYYGDMPKIPMTLRVENCDLEQWQRSATEAGLSVSEWIRRACNAESLIPCFVDDDKNGENSGMRRDEGVSLEKRSTRRNVGRVGAIENVVHETLRNGVKCAHGKQRGELCYKCDGKFGMPNLGE